jgi:predicted metal-dependent HD superfamily phosphohydrolase
MQPCVALFAFCCDRVWALQVNSTMDRGRFQQLWQRCAIGKTDSTVSGSRFDEVCARYNEAHRRYHTPEHIVHCLQQFDAARDLITNDCAVELALWYHDVVYDIGANDNEALSAEFFVRHAQGELSDELIATVQQLIMVTMHLCHQPKTVDEAYLVDIDLSSFGLPWERFQRDSIAVRKEFPQTPDDEFYPKQEHFLGELLRRESFCFTDFFRQRHERQARENISAYLQNLKAQGLL